MSELDPDLQAELDRAPITPTVQTSRLAIFSALAAVLCLPGVSGVLAVVTGLFALRQVNSSSTIQGANLATFGIMAGLLQLVGWGGVGYHVLQVRAQLDPPTAGFMQAWMRSEADGESAAAPGLRPLMRHGEGEVARRALVEQLGGFDGLGPRTDFSYKYDLEGEHVSAAYELRFHSGAPCSARFEYARDQGRLAVVGYALDSPVLRDLVTRGRNALHGGPTPDVKGYDYDSSGDQAAPVKGYHHP